jgi:lipopolysaccharide/colanic/teichoic acid biosynthesis glycosyltransferase
MDDLGERLMMTPSAALDRPIETGPIVASSPRRQEFVRLALVIPTLLAAAAIAVSLEGALMFGAIVVVIAFAIVGAWVVQQGTVPADTVVLVGRGPMASVIASTLGSQVGRGGRTMLVHRAQTIADAAKMIRAARCDEVIFAGTACPDRPGFVDARGVQPVLLTGTEAIERLLGRVPLELAAEDRWFSTLGAVRRLRPRYVFAKRALDVALALTLAIVTLPVIAIVALVIRLDTPGPALFRQQRMGLGGRPFEMIKFRTMRQAEQRPAASGDWTKEVWTQQGDPRITRIGKILRASRIDELPQLWNVLTGDMTFVGPRPEWVKSTAMLEQVLAEYPKRYAVKPGLTGWAQVRYRYTNSIDGQRRKLEYDLYYVKHATLRLDVSIMIRTALVILRLKGL